MRGRLFLRDQLIAMFEVLGFNLVAAPMKMVGAQSACACLL
jgi:hypothetical protein